MRIEDRLSWLLDLYRLREQDTDKSVTNILNALEGLCRLDDPTWKARKLPDDK